MGTVTSLFARKMVAAAGDGIDAAALLTATGLDPHAPWDPEVMIPSETYYALLERIAAQIDVTDLPIRGGAAMRCDDYGALGLAWKAAPDLRGSFSRVERYARLWTSVVRYELRPDARGVLFILHRSGERRFRRWRSGFVMRRRRRRTTTKPGSGARCGSAPTLMHF